MLYKVSGHETFSFRYSWLPKAVRSLDSNPKFFSNEDEAMVSLGVGKNMVRSIRFWSLAAGILAPLPKNGGHVVTSLGKTLLGDKGSDPFLEDISTLWLLHWHLSSNTDNPLLAWDFLLNRWHEPELVPSVCLRVLQREASKYEGNFSPITLEKHFEVFLHTYVPTSGRKGEIQEDNLDCPLVELEFIHKVGERELDRSSGKREKIYAFNREEKPDITAGLFAYCLNDFWEKHHSIEATLQLREVAHGYHSPGQIFKLPEEDIMKRLEELDSTTQGVFSYSESAQRILVHRNKKLEGIKMLPKVYGDKRINA
ncbi:MAG: DUF4007 family protein [Syntrophaceae bacterium]|nr:DUF4007 family protein [Syntrophaceae bacterium]